MKIIPIRRLLNRDHGTLTRISMGVAIGFRVALFGLGWYPASSQAQEPRIGVPVAEVLTRGPVHEAFAGIVSFNPEQGIIVENAPPEAIEELPPDERPEGDNIAWIPGYWAWDDEGDGFLWISGTWRALPPGREWISGYWVSSPPQGYQWISGYWADSTAEETEYLPQPPQTVEAGPNIAAPSRDHGWTPGCWVWHQERYAWSPGYWARGRADWDWMPAHYVSTPRGYVFVDGYWDYTVARRGVLFAPVSFKSNAYSHPGYRYSPSIAIDLVALTENLFLRPHYHHYYFGDYYAPVYNKRGFYSSRSFQSSKYGYDPVYSHQRWEHRQDRDWEQRRETSYQFRRDNESARPPRTWAAQKALKPGPHVSNPHHVLMATPFDQVARGKGNRMRFQRVAEKERLMLAQRGQEVRKSREVRKMRESKAVVRGPGKSGQMIKPVKVKRLPSPIVGIPSSRFPKEHAPPTPQRRLSPVNKDQLKHQTPDRKPEVGRPAPKSPKQEGEKQKPKADKEKPKADKEKPKADKQKPKAEKGKPKAEKEKPKADKEKPKAEKGKPKADKEKPKAEKGKPKANREKPDA